MFGYRRIFAGLGMTALCIATAFAQQATSESTARSIRFNVAVMTAFGRCVTDLQQQDFTIFDNDSTQAITAFKAVIIRPKESEIPYLAYAADKQVDGGCYEQGALFHYVITFNVPDHAGPNEYRRVGVRVDRPNLIVQTRQGYYAPIVTVPQVPVFWP